MTLSDFGFDPHCRLLHRRGENTHFKVKTRVPEPFSTDRRSFLCTGAMKTHFVHRRCGFAKLRKTIAPASENRSSAKLSKTSSNLTVLAEKVRQHRAESPLVFVAAAADRRRTNNVYSSPSPALLRYLLGHLPAPGAKKQRIARGVSKLRLCFDDRRGARNFDHRACH